MPKHSPARNSETSKPNRSITIAELIVITTAMAVAFRLQDYLKSMGIAFLADSPLWFFVVQRTIFAISCALPLAAVWRFCWQKIQFGRFLLHPGHWVLFANFLAIFGIIGPLACCWFFIEESSNELMIWDSFAYKLLLFSQAVFNTVAALVIVYAALKQPRYWIAFFILVAGEFTASAIQWAAISRLVWRTPYSPPPTDVVAMCEWVSAMFNAIACVCLLFAVYRDNESKVKRDAWHWLGILIFLISAVVIRVISYVDLWFIDEPTVSLM